MGRHWTIEAPRWAAADKLQSSMDGNNMDRKKRIRLLSLNLGIAAANIIAFSPGLIGLELVGASALATALGSTIIFLSGAGLIYGNYKLLTVSEKAIPPDKNSTVEDYIEALNMHRGLKTFEVTVDLLIDQIERLKKKNKTIRDIILQIFSAREISYQKFDAVIAEVEKIFFMNIRSILNKLNAFDEEDYNFIREKYEAGAFSKQFMEEKFKVYDDYIAFVKAATEDNEQILLKLDKLLLEISGLNSVESGQLEHMAGMIEIDNLIKQAKYYKN
jgi:parvulin-like peptidyl-prolyl isomerase